MILPVLALLAALAFLGVLLLSGIVALAREVLATARGAMTAMRAPGLEEHEREAAVQRASLRLFVLLGGLVLRSALALGASALPLLAADLAGLVPFAEATDYLARVDVILVLSALLCALWAAKALAWRTR